MADVLRIPSAQHAEWLGGVLGGPGGFACWCRVCFFALVHLHGMRVWCAWMSMRVGLASQGSCAGWFGTPPAPRPPTLCMLCAIDGLPRVCIVFCSDFHGVVYRSQKKKKRIHRIHVYSSPCAPPALCNGRRLCCRLLYASAATLAAVRLLFAAIGERKIENSVNVIDRDRIE